MWLSWLSPNFSKETLWRLMEWYFNVTSNEQYQNCDVKVIAYTEIVLFFVTMFRQPSGGEAFR